MTTQDTLDVRVIESARRKKTVSGRIVGDVIEIRVPKGLAVSERQRHVDELSTKLRRQRSAGEIDLPTRARTLARTHGLPQPSSITWSARQNKRWGSCTPSTGAVRISHRLSDYPGWVLDYVIVHELAHLVHPDHSTAFHELVGRFARAERAEGFLSAVSLGHAGTLSGLTANDTCDETPGAANDD